MKGDPNLERDQNPRNAESGTMGGHDGFLRGLRRSGFVWADGQPLPGSDAFESAAGWILGGGAGAFGLFATYSFFRLGRYDRWAETVSGAAGAFDHRHGRAVPGNPFLLSRSSF